jgi:hypothetical protein
MRVCPSCKNENQPHFVFCLQCGARLPVDPNAPPAQPPRIVPVPEVARCGYCGMKLPDPAAARCPHCSAPL